MHHRQNAARHAAAIAALTPALLAHAQGQAEAASEAADPALPASWVEALEWRELGPANMGGRIIDIAVDPSDHSTFWIATAGAGILKTTNNGTTFEHQFTHEAVGAVGDIDVAPTNPDLLWLGTGENNPRNSVSGGKGVYKSTDGGETWELKGLEDTFSIGEIIIHPEDEDTVFVAAMGRIWGPNEDRGLYKTTDGGDSWDKVLFVDENTGVIELEMNPEDPDVILAATWERQRDEFDTNDPKKRHGPGSGIWRSTDGGDSWDRVTEGLPSADMGRVDFSWSGTDNEVVFAIVDSSRIGEAIENAGYLGIQTSDADAGAKITRVLDDTPAAEAELKEGDVIIAHDGERIVSSDDLLTALAVCEAGDTCTLDVARDGEIIEVEVTLGEDPDPEDKPYGTRLDGQVANVQERQGEEGHEYGGIYRSDDAGESWTRLNSLNDRPMYFSQIWSDPSDHNYQWSAGVSLWKSDDAGETWSNDGIPGEVHVDHHAMWIDPDDGEHIMLGNDGGLYVTYDRGETWDHLNHFAIGQFYHANLDNQPLYTVYGGLQDNGTWGAPNLTRSGDGTFNSDWFRVGGGDGFIVHIDADDPEQLYYSSQNGGVGRVHMGTGERRGLRPREPKGVDYRWNWKTPYLLSHHNSKVFYSAGNFVFQSFDKGSDLKPISPEITRTRRGSATALDESPVDRDHLMVGTDDGALWVTTDGGENWANIVFPYDPAEFPEEEEEDNEKQDATPESKKTEGPDLGQMFDRLDLNDDNRLQRDEVPEAMAFLFDLLDGNKNNELTKREIREGREGIEPEPKAEPESVEDEEPFEPDLGNPEAVWGTEESTGPAFNPDDPLVGVWTIEGGELGAVTIEITRNEDDELAAIATSNFLDDAESKSIDFNQQTGALRMVIDSGFGDLVIEAEVDAQTITGSVSLDEFDFQDDFEGSHTGGGETETSGTPLAELIPGPRRVQSIEWSKFDADRVYITLDAHYADDDNPYVFMSDDAGRSWQGLHGGLPQTTTRVLREDLENEDVLYLGTETKLFVSIDRGVTWTELNSNLPTVAIHEIAQHWSGQIVAGTHGRSLWALDITPIQQMTEQARTADIHLYTPADVVRWNGAGSRGRGATRWFAGENPGRDAKIFYSITDEPDDLAIRVFNAQNKLVRTLEIPSREPGLHAISWDLRDEPRELSNGRRARFGRSVPTGTYRVEMEAGDITVSRSLEVHDDPDAAGAGFAFDQFNTELYEEEESGPASERSDF